MSDNYVSRRISIDLTRGHGKFLDKELSRLKAQFGFKLSYQDYITLLLDMQRVRVLAQQGDNPKESIGWMFQKMMEMHDEVLSKRKCPADDASGDDGMDTSEDWA